MTRVPMGASIGRGQVGFPFGPDGRRALRRPVGGLVPQGISAELIADKWGLTREDLDAFGGAEPAARRAGDGRGPLRERDRPVGEARDRRRRVIESTSRRDEGIRPGTTVETLAKLKPAFKEDGKVTAGNSSQITDGASAVLIMSEEKANAARPHAACPLPYVRRSPASTRSRCSPARSPPPRRCSSGPGCTIDDIDLIEINEAFASVVLAWEKEHHPDMSKVNVNGGAIALGHPLGCSGAKLMATLLNELERTGGRYGLQTMCEGGGMANATIIERLG